jgi:hypothetical protein
MLSGVQMSEVGHCPGRAVADASATGRTKAATTRSRSDTCSTVGCLPRRQSPANPSATDGGTCKADRHLPWQTTLS